MAIEVRIPTLGESVTEGVIVRWMKSDGESVEVDEPLLELETDKASVEIPAPETGVLKILKPEGEKVQVNEVVARIEPGKAAANKERPVERTEARAKAGETQPEAQAAPARTKGPPLSPAVRRLVEERDLDARAIAATGRGGRLTKGDVLAHIEKLESNAEPAKQERESTAPEEPAVEAQVRAAPLRKAEQAAEREEEMRVPMTHLRQRIAERLVQAQRTAAILTTFNEIDMNAVMELRSRYKDRFREAHGIGLGFMSFFARACIAALQEMPLINAQIDGSDIVYKRRVHLGVAVGTERGLVVPVLHYADRMSFAEIEREIERLAKAARENKLGIADLSGGTFTISNGGVYGSLLSTPILNPPQSAILGMHKIERRPVAVGDQVVIRPMMYVALSYDHRLIDGAEAVTFLVRVKERIEDPARLLLEV